MEKNILIFIILIMAVLVILLGVIGWQTGFVVKDTGQEKNGLKILGEKTTFDENKNTTKSTTPTGDVIRISDKSSSGSGSSGSSGGDSNTNQPSPTPDNKINVRVFVNLSSLTSTKDKEFIVKIDVSSQEEIYAAGFELSFGSILELIEVKEGNFLKKDGASTYPVTNINDTKREIKFGNTRFNVQSGVSGEGSLAEIKFKAVNIGKSDLILNNVEITDTSLDVNKFQVSVENGKITIT